MNQLVHALFETAMVERCSVAADEPLEFRRQLLTPRHRGSVQEHRNDGNAVLQSSGDFNANEVIRVIQTPLASRIYRRSPIRSYQDEPCGCPVDTTPYRAHEILTRRDR